MLVSPILKRNIELLERLPEPKDVFKYLLICTEIPRKSSNLEQITEFLIAFADAHNLEYETDDIGNLVIRKEASPEYENVPGIIMQSHMDIVCVNDVEFDFLKDPIKCILEGNELKAEGTTLGADNGIGIAASLAVLSSTFEHGPLEALFTVDEETTLDGAMYLSTEILKSKSMINLDSEEHDRICVGSAGGFKLEYYIDHESTEENLENYRKYKIEISGLSGGHSGIDINKGNMNSIKLLAEILDIFSSVYIVDIDGGIATNSIPTTSSCTFYTDTPREVVEAILKTFKICRPGMKEQLEIHITELDMNSISTDIILSDRICSTVIDLIRVLKHGVHKYSEDIEDSVELSLNVAMIKNVDGEILLHVFPRYETKEQEEEIFTYLTDIGRNLHVRMSDKLHSMPGWKPNMNSDILECVRQSFEFIGAEYKEHSVHAGLESGFISEKYPDMDIISIGPTILNAHTTSEVLHVDTVSDFYAVLVNTMIVYAQKLK